MMAAVVVRLVHIENNTQYFSYNSVSQTLTNFQNCLIVTFLRNPFL